MKRIISNIDEFRTKQLDGKEDFPLIKQEVEALRNKDEVINMTIGEAKEGLIRILHQTKIANECGLSTNDFRTEIEIYEKVLAELDKQEKIINAMVEYISSLDIDEDICKKRTEDCYADIYDDKTCTDCVKQYYEKKVCEE